MGAGSVVVSGSDGVLMGRMAAGDLPYVSTYPRASSHRSPVLVFDFGFEFVQSSSSKTPPCVP